MKTTFFFQFLLLIFISIFIGTGCISTKRYEAFTKEKVKDIPAQYEINLPDYLTIKTDSMVFQDSIVHITKGKSYFIPAIFYWESQHNIRCDLHPTIPLSIFKNQIVKLADESGLVDKLGTKKLELTITQIPSSFIYNHNEKVLIFIIAYSTSGGEIIYPILSPIKVNYRIIDNHEVIKEGTIQRPNGQKTITNIWKSTKKFTWAFIDDYQLSCAENTKQIFQGILEVVNEEP